MKKLAIDPCTSYQTCTYNPLAWKWTDQKNLTFNRNKYLPCFIFAHAAFLLCMAELHHCTMEVQSSLKVHFVTLPFYFYDIIVQ